MKGREDMEEFPRFRDQGRCKGFVGGGERGCAAGILELNKVGQKLKTKILFSKPFRV